MPDEPNKTAGSAIVKESQVEKFIKIEKIEKIEHKEKPEKIEHKEKPEKFEHKEKPEKFEHKEKPEKLEHKEIEKYILEKFQEQVNPGGPVEQRLTALEQTVASLHHFITTGQRPDLTKGALTNEPDKKSS